MGILLHIIAYLLLLILAPIGVVYSLFRLWFKANFRLWWKRLNEYFTAIAIMIDILGNVLAQDLFDDILIKKEGYKFGNNKETISKVLGMNEIKGTLKPVGQWLVNVLNRIEENHCINATKA